MKILLKSKIFIGAFLLIYSSFFALTIFVLELKIDGLGIGHKIYGFPFGYYYSSCFGGDYLWEGLLANILFAAGLGFAGGLTVSYFWMKFSSPEFRAKWYL